MKNRIAIIGAGRVGTTIAYSLITKNLVSELMLVDINTDRCEGEVRDLADTLAFCETAKIKSAELHELHNVDIIIVSAGHAQQPGETRAELYKKNKSIVQAIVKAVSSNNPQSILLIITNPMDAMTLVAQKASSLPRNQVFGSGTWLDSQRLRRYLGQECEVAPESIDAFVIGEHGDSQCVAWSHTHIGGTPVKQMNISDKRLNELAQQTKQEAYTIIEKKCATYYGIAACATDICEAIIFDQKRIMPLSNFIPELEVCLSLPVVIGAQGIERNIPLNLDENETACLKNSAEQVKKIIDKK
jgi:L-lactate dehydrogenase